MRSSRCGDHYFVSSSTRGDVSYLSSWRGSLRPWIKSMSLSRLHFPPPWREEKPFPCLPCHERACLENGRTILPHMVYGFPCPRDDGARRRQRDFGFPCARGILIERHGRFFWLKHMLVSKPSCPSGSRPSHEQHYLLSVR